MLNPRVKTRRTLQAGSWLWLLAACGLAASACGPADSTDDEEATGEASSELTSVTISPRTVACPGATYQNVVNVGTVSLAMTAQQTVYVVSVMRVDSATYRSLFDNEVVCTGPGGWSKNMVLGQNVLQQGTGVAQWEDVSLTTRYLVHPGVAGRVTCKAYVRATSLGNVSATFRLASGRLWFADASVGNAVDGLPAQSSVPPGNLDVDSATPTVRQPATGFFDLQSGFTGLSVIADAEYMVCNGHSACNMSGVSQARFTLIVNQWKADGSLCHGASTSVTKSIPYSVHHAFVPLNQSNFPVRTGNGCVPRFNAYVRVDWLSGNSGAIQGVARGLTDYTAAPAGRVHDSDMSHIFVVPY